MGLQLQSQGIRLEEIAPEFALLLALPAEAQQKKRVCEVGLAEHVS